MVTLLMALAISFLIIAGLVALFLLLFREPKK